jgi:hypothetical protein
MTPWVEPTHFATKALQWHFAPSKSYWPSSQPRSKGLPKGLENFPTPLVKGPTREGERKLKPLFQPPSFLLPVRASDNDSLG